MNPKIISIIGGTGQMGSMFAEAFRKKGYEVIVAGRKTATSPIEAAKKGDVVIITVPIRATEQTIKEIAPYVRKDSLLTDFTSVKVNPCKAMEKYSSSEIIGGHPVFGPKVSFEKQNFVLCPIKGEKYLGWYKEFLSSLGINVLIASPEEHDKAMAVIQCLNHLSNLAFVETLKDANFDLEKNRNIFSPSFLIKILGIGRFLSQDPALYSDIEIENPYSKEIANKYVQSIKKIVNAIEKGNKAEFEGYAKECKDYFGDLTKESLDITNQIIDEISKIKSRKPKK